VGDLDLNLSDSDFVPVSEGTAGDALSIHECAVRTPQVLEEEAVLSLEFDSAVLPGNVRDVELQRGIRVPPNYAGSGLEFEAAEEAAEPVDAKKRKPRSLVIGKTPCGHSRRRLQRKSL